MVTLAQKARVLGRMPPVRSSGPATSRSGAPLAGSDAPRAEEISCVLHGPPGTGKTSFVRALHRGCWTADEGDVLVHAAGQAAVETGEAALRAVVAGGGALEPTEKASAYAFDVSVRRRDILGRARREDARLRVVDTAGWAPHHAPHLVTAPAWSADVLGLCVDPCSPCEPQLWQLVASLLAAPLFTEELLDPAVRSWGEATPAPLDRAAPRAQLRVRSLLLLFLKADRYAAMDRAARDDMGAPTERAIAASLCPVQLAHQTVGLPLLRWLSDALAPGARFAVGVCSSGGFTPQGRPFLDAGGRVRRVLAEAGEAQFDCWAPYGIADVVRFAVNGRESSTVRRLRPEDLA